MPPSTRTMIRREARVFHHWILFLLYMTSGALYIMYIVYASVFLKTEISTPYESANPLPRRLQYGWKVRKSVMYKEPPGSHHALTLFTTTISRIYKHAHKSTPLHIQKHTLSTRHGMTTSTTLTGILSGWKKKKKKDAVHTCSVNMQVTWLWRELSQVRVVCVQPQRFLCTKNMEKTPLN